jgi:cell division protein FtsI (penicillin-binding protein 3)
MKPQKARLQAAKKTADTKDGGRAGANRFRLVVVLFVLWMCIIGARLVNLQTVQHADLYAKAVEQRRDKHKTKPLRGSILDRNGRDLAVTLEAESLEIDPTELENTEAAAYQLAKVLGKNPRELLTTLNDGKATKRKAIPLARELEADKIQEVKNLGIAKGLIWRKEQKRFYPNQTLAAQIIGFTNREDVGQAGIEAAQEKNLRGEYGEITIEKDGSGQVYEMTKTVTQPPRKVVLTIDSTIQHIVEQSLVQGLNAARAKSGSAVVLNPANGEILAMASAPTFNPASPGDVKPENWINRAVQNFYEPGSTFKLVTYSAALEEGIVRPEDEIDASAGFIKVGSRQIKDTGRKGVFTLTEALARSSNVAAITLGQRVGKERLFEYMRRFGYGAQTGVELPVESRGLLYAPEKWSADSIGSVPIGYEVGVTTLQSAAAFAAIANDGVRVSPHIIKEIREDDDKIFFAPQPEQRRVVSEMTARRMRQMLSAVTEDGTAKKAQLANYTTAGKTGTAHKFDAQKRKYSQSKYFASFVGFAPVEKPAVVIAVMVDEPQLGGHHGGDAAAPIFRDIAEQILPALHVTPDISPIKKDDVFVAKQTTEVQPTKIVAETVGVDDKTLKPEKPKTAEKNEKAKPEAKKTDKESLKNNEPRERVVETKKPKAEQNPVKSKSPPQVTKTKAEGANKAVNNKGKGKT